MSATVSRQALRASSTHLKASAAAEDMCRQLQPEQAALTVLFHSPRLDDPSKFYESVSRRAAGRPVIGCSSSGEIGPDGYQNDTIVGFSLPKADFKVAVAQFSNLADFTVDRAHRLCSDAKADLERQGVDIDDGKTFAILLVDGLSKSEEPLTYKLQESLQKIPLVGGSSGDGQRYLETTVYGPHGIDYNGGVLVLVHSDWPWELIMEQHMRPTDRKLIVTEADPESRVITEFNAEPASLELARILDLDSEADLTASTLAANPMMLQLGNTWFIRSVHSIEPDHSVRLFCSIDEGMVLSLGHATNLPKSLNTALEEIESRIGEIQLTIAFDCILRRLELETNDQLAEASSVMTKHKGIGFSTYGEQFGSVHVNQTLTGIAIAAPAR